jgi:TPR repeat protein
MVRIRRILPVLLAAVMLVACSDYQKARRAYEVGNFTEALQMLEKLAKDGDSRAQYEVALMYLQGIGTKIDPMMGGKWMLASANNGNTTAMVEIGGRHEAGVNAEKNPIIAFTWFRRAAIAGDAIGKYKLAMMYETGEGVPEDLPRAYAWYKLSASTAGRVAAERVHGRLNLIERQQAERLVIILEQNPEG